MLASGGPKYAPKTHAESGCYVEATASGKAILLGEHAVLYGCEALAIPLHTVQMRVTAQRLGEHTQNQETGNSSRFYLGASQLPEHAAGVIDDGFAALGIPKYPVHIQGNSDIKVGSGLGSSATLSVITLKALNQLSGNSELKAEQLATLGRQLENRFHGNSSGLDPSVVAYNQPLLYSITEGPQPIEVCMPPKGGWHFALIDSQVRSSTYSMVLQARPFFTTAADGAQRLEKFKAVVRQGFEALTHGNVSLLAEAFHKNLTLLTEVGVVSEALHHLVHQANQLGCLASKVTGAGGGGFVIALLPPENPEQVLQKLQEHFKKHQVIHVSV
ncbi:MAG: mevalonate kinase [Zetaproteobacteria bacterium]|nr:mevalonate kinase [Zetaproteobacteria bacterium]